jgi:tRNA dimethylallyltransferase
LVIVGPTAAGKTEIACRLAGNKFEIISADSVQVYKYLDIGSGKPSPADRERIRHYLIDWVEPDFHFTAGEFCRGARSAADEILARNKLPMIVGGTGLYIDSFFQGLSEIPDVPKNFKKELHKELNDRGLERLHQELLLTDPEFGERIHPGDTQRILRGLEVFRGTGKPISSFYKNKRVYGPRDAIFVGICEERGIINKRIEKRVDRMVSRGLVDEVQSLRKSGYGNDLQSMKSIGYAEINRYLDGFMTLDEAVEKIKTATKKYAKRQMTWFRKNTSIHWFKNSEWERIRELMQHRLDSCF